MTQSNLVSDNGHTPEQTSADLADLPQLDAEWIDEAQRLIDTHSVPTEFHETEFVLLPWLAPIRNLLYFYGKSVADVDDSITKLTDIRSYFVNFPKPAWNWVGKFAFSRSWKLLNDYRVLLETLPDTNDFGVLREALSDRRPTIVSLAVDRVCDMVNQRSIGHPLHGLSAADALFELDIIEQSTQTDAMIASDEPAASEDTNTEPLVFSEMQAVLRSHGIQGDQLRAITEYATAIVESSAATPDPLLEYTDTLTTQLEQNLNTLLSKTVDDLGVLAYAKASCGFDRSIKNPSRSAEEILGTAPLPPSDTFPVKLDLTCIDNKGRVAVLGQKQPVVMPALLSEPTAGDLADANQIGIQLELTPAQLIDGEAQKVVTTRTFLPHETNDLVLMLDKAFVPRKENGVDRRRLAYVDNVSFGSAEELVSHLLTIRDYLLRTKIIRPSLLRGKFDVRFSDERVHALDGFKLNRSYPISGLGISMSFVPMATAPFYKRRFVWVRPVTGINRASVDMQNSWFYGAFVQPTKSTDELVLGTGHTWMIYSPRAASFVSGVINSTDVPNPVFGDCNKRLRIQDAGRIIRHIPAYQYAWEIMSNYLPGNESVHISTVMDQADTPLAQIHITQPDSIPVNIPDLDHTQIETVLTQLNSPDMSNIIRQARGTPTPMTASFSMQPVDDSKRLSPQAQQIYDLVKRKLGFIES